MSTSGVEGLGPFITNRFGDRYLYEVNRSAFDQVGSAAVYQKYFGEDLFQSNRLFVVVGTDSGLLLRHIQKQPLPDGTRYLFVELPAVIEALLAEGDLQDLPERIRVVSLEEAWTQAEDFQLQNYLFLGAVFLRESLAAMDSYLPDYRELSNYLSEQLQAIEWAVRGGLGCKDFILRQFENLGENRIPAIHLKDRYCGKTAVILGGGPSLDELLPWVRDHQDELAVFAVSRVSRRLLEFGLTPHLIFSVDPHDVSFDVSKEMLKFWDKSLFVHSYHVSPKLLGQWRGRSAYVGARYPWRTKANPENLDTPGPTVTNTALSLAVQMGFSQVVLAGVDLCFNKEGMTHASGSNESAAGPKLDNVLTVETNGGWRAETGPDYFKAMEILDQQAALARDAGCRIINPAAGAAKMEHIEFLPVENLEYEPLDRPMLPGVFDFLPEEDVETRTAHYQSVLQELECVQNDLEKIKDLAGEALYCNKGLFGRSGKKANFKYKLRMDKIEKRLNQEFSELIPLVKKFGIEDFIQVTRLDNEKEWSDEEIEKTADTYYSAYKNSASRLLNAVKSSIDRISIRRAEETSLNDFSSLCEQWLNDGQPGRFYVWRDRYPDLQDEELDSSAETLKTQFDKEMHVVETVQAKRARQMRSLGPLRGKAVRLYKRGDKDGLARISDALSKHENQEEAASLRSLVQGYLAEINDNHDLALECYQELIGESFNALTEDALRRIASISLQSGQLEYAKLALECLAGAIFVYKPQYADFLRLLGQNQAAADLYVDYLERVPSDLGVLIKLGRLYHSMGVSDVARQVFQMALEQDPENYAIEELISDCG